LALAELLTQDQTDNLPTRRLTEEVLMIKHSLAVFAAVSLIALLGLTRAADDANPKKGSAVKDNVPDELQKLEKDWNQAIIKNDADAIGRFVSDDWVIIDPEGNVIEKMRFLGVIKAGDLTHESMEFEDLRVRVYGDTAVITAQAKSKGKYKGQAFNTHERSTSVYAKKDGRWQCVITQLTPINNK
jgi:ketosteroid isomerase-like protein